MCRIPVYLDISEWLDFGFYDHVWYWDTPNDDIASSKIVRWLGVSHRKGSGLCYWLLKENGQVLSKTTVQHVTCLDLDVDDVKQKIKTYDGILTVRLDDENFQLNPNNDNAFKEFWGQLARNAVSNHTGSQIPPL
jgi:hypothetical protein